jgi:hypothetical protein
MRGKIRRHVQQFLELVSIFYRASWGLILLAR